MRHIYTMLLQAKTTNKSTASCSLAEKILFTPEFVNKTVESKLTDYEHKNYHGAKHHVVAENSDMTNSS